MCNGAYRFLYICDSYGTICNEIDGMTRQKIGEKKKDSASVVDRCLYVRGRSLYSNEYGNNDAVNLNLNKRLLSHIYPQTMYSN